MRVFKTRWFARFSRRVNIADEMLCEAVQRAERGIIDADLGGSVIKQRVARPGQGRSGGYRVLIGYQRAHRAVFLYGFAKNERDNIDDDELTTLREIAAMWLNMGDKRLQQALADGLIEEVDCGQKD